MKQVECTAVATDVVAPVATMPPCALPLHDSVALKRLLDEVRFDSLETASAATAYNRQHNRHNR
jgi:hypothetical protein